MPQRPIPWASSGPGSSSSAASGLLHSADHDAVGVPGATVTPELVHVFCQRDLLATHPALVDDVTGRRCGRSVHPETPVQHQRKWRCTALFKQRRSSRWHPSSSSAQQSSPRSPSRAGGLSPAPRPGHARQRGPAASSLCARERGVTRARGRGARQRGAQAARGKGRLNFLYSRSCRFRGYVFRSFNHLPPTGFVAVDTILNHG